LRLKTQNTELSSPDKYERHPTKFGAKEKNSIPSFLEGFNALSEDDMEIMAEFEEEQQRLGHFETLFPTRETVESLGPYFECQRHANSVLW